MIKKILLTTILFNVYNSSFTADGEPKPKKQCTEPQSLTVLCLDCGHTTKDKKGLADHRRNGRKKDCTTCADAKINGNVSVNIQETDAICLFCSELITGVNRYGQITVQHIIQHINKMHEDELRKFTTAIQTS